MTDLVAWPKPRFTSRETVADCKCYGGTKSGNTVDLIIFAMAAPGADHNGHQGEQLEVGEYLVVSGFGNAISLRTFALYRRTIESMVSPW